MQMISRPVHSMVCECYDMLVIFVISWISCGVRAAASTNGKWQKKRKLFKSATMRAVLTNPNSFDLKQAKICSGLNSEFLNGFLQNLVKERRIQLISFIESPFCKETKDALKDNDTALEILKTPCRYLSKQITSNLTVFNGGSKNLFNCVLWPLQLSSKVADEEILMDPLEVRSGKCFPQYHLWPVTSKDGTVASRSFIWPFTSDRDSVVANQSHQGSLNPVKEETIDNSKSERSLQFGMSEAEGSGECKDSRQSELLTEGINPIGGLEQKLFIPIKDCKIEYEDDLETRNRQEMSPDSSLSDIELSPPRLGLKESCGNCGTEIKKSKFFTQRRFGLLSNCNHVFCYPCIYKESKPTSTPLIRSTVCPICHIESDAVAASAVWREGVAKNNFFKKFVEGMKCSRNENGFNKTLLSEKQFPEKILSERPSFPTCDIAV